MTAMRCLVPVVTTKSIHSNTFGLPARKSSLWLSLSDFADRAGRNGRGQGLPEP
jgi:hypothetical protein